MLAPEFMCLNLTFSHRDIQLSSAAYTIISVIVIERFCIDCSVIGVAL